MGATTLVIVRGRVCCYFCKEDVEEFNLGQERTDAGTDRYVLLCNTCMELVDGTTYPANTTPPQKEAH